MPRSHVHPAFPSVAPHCSGVRGLLQPLQAPSGHRAARASSISPEISPIIRPNHRHAGVGWPTPCLLPCRFCALTSELGPTQRQAIYKPCMARSGYPRCWIWVTAATYSCIWMTCFVLCRALRRGFAAGDIPRSGQDSPESLLHCGGQDK